MILFDVENKHHITYIATLNSKSELFMQQKVRAKKHLGQHFLNDERIAYNIVKALTDSCTSDVVLEIGPGMGVLTKHLLTNNKFKTYALEVDLESVDYLKAHYPEITETLFQKDFLKTDLPILIPGNFCLIGNFPYNISSQIVFKMLENKQHIPIMVGMFQKEVAERIAAPSGNKSYGILSVLSQVFYDVEYLFTVHEDVFIPPPKVKSGVIRMVKKTDELEVDVKLFYRVVKTAFNQRRKKLRNALHVFNINDAILQASGFIDKRAEQLSVTDFITLTKLISIHGEHHD
jgi:16S rRNA (adenine1518-N6/adenine1519-N6)-dimethyltransferase